MKPHAALRQGPEMYQGSLVPQAAIGMRHQQRPASGASTASQQQCWLLFPWPLTPSQHLRLYS